MDKIFKSLGASNHTENEREKNDYYATDPLAIDELLKKETLNHNIRECACGGLHLSNRLKELGYNVRTSDLIKRVEDDNIEVLDFLSYQGKYDGDIVTNPPYILAKEFVLKALDIVSDGNKVVMFLKLLFLESQNRYEELFKLYPPKKIYVFSKRVRCQINGDFSKKDSSAICYAWYVWEKGYKGLPTIDWINNTDALEEQADLWEAENKN